MQAVSDLACKERFEMTETEKQVLGILQDIACNPDQNDLTKCTAEIIELVESRQIKILSRLAVLQTALQDHAAKVQEATK